MKLYIFLLLTELLRRTKRRWVLSTLEIMEEDKGPFPKSATKLFNDQEHNFDHSYEIAGHGVDEEPLGVFSIDPTSGEVFIHKPIDRELYPLFHIKFDVYDKSNGQTFDRQLAFDVEIIDINDNAPLFEQPVKRTSIKENQKQGLLPISLTATDPDKENTDNSKITMSIVEQEPAYPKFGITKINFSQNSQLNFTGCFNYDEVREYKVIVKARDHGDPVMFSTATVLIKIEDSNTNPPVFTKTKHEAEVIEKTENQVVLKLAVTDKDTPKTPGWRAKYKILKGNEARNYKIETDPETNEGILTIIKAKDYEVTSKTNLIIGVENEEPLFVCESKGANEAAGLPPPQTAEVTITVIDVNDAPIFTKKVTTIHEKEEEEPGKVLYRPIVTDVDSDVSAIRYELVRDPAKWMKIDPKTGEVKSIQRMDLESPHVNDSIYTVIVHAIDNGKPPMTGTGTLLIHLSDENDNSPFLMSKETYICGDKDTSVNFQADDYDKAPFKGPFTFSLRGDKSVKKQWKLDPDTGETATLVSIKPLPSGTYTIPLTIADQQGKSADEDLQVVVCNCGQGSVCKDRMEKSSVLGGAGIAALFAGILAFLLLLCLCLLCDCKGDKLKPLYFQNEGNQTLMKYNEEGGSSEYKSVPPPAMSPATSYAVTDGVMPARRPLTQMPTSFPHGEASGTLGTHGMGLGMETGIGMGMAMGMGMGMGTGMDVDMFKNGQGMEALEAQWNARKNTTRGKHTQNQNLMPSSMVSELIGLRLLNQKEEQLDFPGYHPQEYAYEGTGSISQSLDKLSLGNYGDNLDFLQHLGPKFNTLDEICRQAFEEKNLKL